MDIIYIIYVEFNQGMSFKFEFQVNNKIAIKDFSEKIKTFCESARKDIQEYTSIFIKYAKI